MEARQIINGLSEIKIELIKKSRLDKSPRDLGLWFSFEHNVLYVHDAANHKNNIVLALIGAEKYKIYFATRTFGYDVVEHAIETSMIKKDFAKTLNDLFNDCGFWSV